MWKSKWLLLMMQIWMSGCQITAVPTESACAWVKPISTNKADRASMSRAVKEQIVVHNELWDSHCMK